MKQSLMCIGLCLSTILSLVNTKALLAVFDATVVLGGTYEVEWLSDISDVSIIRMQRGLRCYELLGY